MNIKLKGISKRGKERIKEHGDEFVLKQAMPNSSSKGNEILVESLDNTWRGEKWLGWFEVGKDVEIVR